MVGARLRRLAHRVPGGAAGPGPDPADLLRLLQAGPRDPGTATPTVDLRRTILDGDILLVSTGQGSVGRRAAALAGASLLNLVDAVICEQERLPLAQRRGALVMVDEMQTIPGVEFGSMLSELGKYRASFPLATQSLAKLGALGPTMRDTPLANVCCVAVFPVSGRDAHDLA